MASDPDADPIDEQELVLGDLLNHVLDKGVVISGSVILSVADIDLVRVGLSVMLAAAETIDRPRRREDEGDDLPVLPAERER
jgi:hypothetical protein